MHRKVVLLLAASMLCASTHAQTYTTRSLQGQYPQGEAVEISAATTTPNGVELVGIRSSHNGLFDRTPLIFPTATSNAVVMNMPPFGTGGYISAVATTPLGVIEAGQYDRVVGSTITTHAVVWNGSPSSAVDLHIASNTPVGQSLAYGVSAAPIGFQATGMIENNGRDAAAMWSGATPQSSTYALLHAGNMFQSRAPVAYTFNGVAKQAGYAEFPGPGFRHPVVWSGTADSYLDILPAQFFAGEVYCATAEGGQELLGGICLDATSDRPVVWRGIGGTVQVLSGTPERQGGGVRYLSSTRAVGQIHNGASYHAAIWDLTTGQVTDLHGFLPPEYQFGTSSALYVDAAGNVYGSAEPSGANFAIPFVWTIPEPSGAAITALVLAPFSGRSMRRRPVKRA